MAENKRKFSLIELTMIIMLVGIIITLVVPLKQKRTYQQKTKEAVSNMQIIAKENLAFKANENLGAGFYAMDISQLNLNWDELGKKYNRSLTNLYFDYSLTDSTVIATSKDAFGKKDAQIEYFLPNGPFRVHDDTTSRSIIDANWLP